MAARPTVWVLLGRGAGGNAQMTSLAAELGWPYETKHLVYNRISHCPNLLLGASVLGVDRRRSSALDPPWPDLVIAGSRRSAPVARWIRKHSDGRARLVHLMHTQAPWEHFDLIITTPQYRLPERPNILHNTAPLTRVDPQRLAAAVADWAPRLAHLPRPFTALLVGGNSSTFLLDAVTAARLGREVGAQVRASGGALLLTTSARTPAAAADALLAAIDCPAHVYRWRANDADNPYFAYLALADRFVVTADSASLVAEACMMENPVQIFEWPVRPDANSGVKGLLRRWGEARDRQARSGRTPSRFARLYDRLVHLGLIKPARDFDGYHRALRARGLLSALGETVDSPARRPLDDMQRALDRIHALYPERVGHPDVRDHSPRRPAPLSAPPPLDLASRAALGK